MLRGVSVRSSWEGGSRARHPDRRGRLPNDRGPGKRRSGEPGRPLTPQEPLPPGEFPARMADLLDYRSHPPQPPPRCSPRALDYSPHSPRSPLRTTSPILPGRTVPALSGAEAARPIIHSRHPPSRQPMLGQPLPQGVFCLRGIDFKIHKIPQLTT